MGQQLKTCAEDQAYLFRAVTGVSVPNAPGSSVATPHVHDGTNGAIIPIPYYNHWLNADLRPQASFTDDDYGRFAMPVFYAPTGHTQARVIVVLDSPFTANHLYVRVMNQSMAYTVQSAGFTQAIGIAGRFAYFVDVNIAPGEVNCIEHLAWDAYNYPGSNAPMPSALPRRVYQIMAFPLAGATPHPALNYVDSSAASTEVKLPIDTQHVGAHAFTSFDDGMFADGRSVSSYIVQGEAMNNALCYELLTGRPAGNRATATYRGHAHQADTSVSTTSNNGALIEQPLGSWNYGVARRSSSSSGHMNQDHVALTTTQNWTGRIHAPCVTTTTTTAVTVADHLVNLPAALAANVQGASSKLKAAALVRIDTSRMASGDVRFQLRNISNSSGGTTKTVTVSTDGLAIYVGSAVDLYGSGGGPESIIFRTQIRQGSSVDGESICIYSSCLWMEP